MKIAMRWTYNRVLVEEKFVKNVMLKLFGIGIAEDQKPPKHCLKTTVSKLYILKPPEFSKHFIVTTSLTLFSHFIFWISANPYIYNIVS
jgi:hypothetical protein